MGGSNVGTSEGHEAAGGLDLDRVRGLALSSDSFRPFMLTALR